MDLGSEVWLVLMLILPWLAIGVVLLLKKKRVKPSKNVSIAISIITIALFAIYWVWSLFFRH